MKQPPSCKASIRLSHNYLLLPSLLLILSGCPVLVVVATWHHEACATGCCLQHWARLIPSLGCGPAPSATCCHSHTSVKSNVALLLVTSAVEELQPYCGFSMLEEQRLQQGHIYLASFPYGCAQLEEDCQAFSMATFFCSLSWGILVHVKKFFL